MFAASKTDSVSAVAADPQFNYVTMLLHGDGTNGAQNNTFLDSSASPLTLTRNGNTTQGSFSPYGSNWSNFFDGTGDRLSIASASALNIGSADMTMEFWMLIPSAFPSDYRVLFAKGTNTSGGNSYAIEGMSSGALTLWVNTDGSSGWNLFNGTTIGTPTVGAWNHVVVCRSGTAWYSFMNGTRVLNTTGAGTVTASSSVVTIGDFGTAGFEYTGYISNLRLVNGTAIYANATTCTVPTTPLTAVTNTSLLTCQSNRFIDNSASPLTITTSGLPSVQRFNPFGTSTAYSTSVISGSGYFDGTGDYLSTPNVSALQVGTSTNPFCVECWVYPTNTPSSDIAILGNYKVTSYPTNTDGFDILQTSSNGVALRWGYPNYADSGVSAGMTLYAWNHIAVCRNSSGSMSCYLNGTRWFNTSTNTSITNATASSFWVGWAGSLSGTTVNPFLGYISNARLVKGSAVYDPTSSTLTVPTAPLTAITNTSLLTNFTNGAIFDNAMMNDLETVGNAQISTSVKKYGTGSIYFDSSGDALYSKSQSVTFGTGDFTLEFWINFNAVNNSTVKFIYDMRNSGATSASFLAQEAGNTWTYWNGAGTSISSGFTSSTFTDSTWTHVAICRSSGTTRFFAGGTLTNSVADTSNYANSTLTFGARYSISDFLNAWIDDLRITKGYARYTATFTPPTAAFLDIGPN